MPWPAGLGDILSFATVFTFNLDALGFACAAGGNVSRYAGTALFFFGGNSRFACLLVFWPIWYPLWSARALHGRSTRRSVALGSSCRLGLRPCAPCQVCLFMHLTWLYWMVLNSYEPFFFHTAIWPAIATIVKRPSETLIKAMSGCCLTCATSILPANKAFWSTPTSFAARVTRLPGTEKEQPSKRTAGEEYQEYLSLVDLFPVRRMISCITIMYNNIISREIWRICFEEYDTHILCFNDFRTDQSSRAALLQICLSHVIFFEPFCVRTWKLLDIAGSGFKMTEKNFWTSWFHFAIWHADVFALWPSSHASWLGRVAWLTSGCCSVAGYNASLWSMCHVPCVGLHRFCLLCSMECTKVVWPTKAVQWSLSSFMWCWFAMN